MSRLSGPLLDALTGWLPGNDDPDRPRIQLASLDEHGRPDIRTVLLSEWDEDGFYLHTDALSRKAAQLSARPDVAFDLLWPDFARQLVVQGRAEIADPAEQARAYARRSPYLRQLAYLNTAEVARLAPEERRRAWAEFAATRHLEALKPAPTWTGYLIRPSRVTLWEAAADAPSHRIEYTASPSGWEVAHLPG